MMDYRFKMHHGPIISPSSSLFLLFLPEMTEPWLSKLNLELVEDSTAVEATSAGTSTVTTAATVDVPQIQEDHRAAALART